MYIAITKQHKGVQMVSRRELLAGSMSVAAISTLIPAAGLAAGPAQPVGRPIGIQTKDGLTLSAMSYGAASALSIIFVHGLSQSRLSWDRQIVSDLAYYHLITFDLRGHGDSDKPAEPEAYADGARWADDLAAVIEQTGSERVVLVGWSFGGLVIGHYLRRHGAGAVAGINLVDAVTSFDPQFRTEESGYWGARLASPELDIRSEAIARFLSLCFATPPHKNDLDRMLAYNGMVPRAVHLGLGKIEANGLDEGFAHVPRILLTHGARDALVLPDMSRRMLAVNPRSNLSIYPEGGHSPFYEDAARFNRELAGFSTITTSRKATP
ncbi:alpha/beta fold hydrolase [Paracoccus yeei]|uniref:alpha/beta fold hydrolase n=2 Tax=Paracoccus yeei TaxID=147645 RepID=UPI0009DED5F9|nr:alpha/beta hydrolase [Paracoccus yeei]